jgi:phenylpyruvate tautomerase PptA (4-oxalocrotonate tautomerase family)
LPSHSWKSTALDINNSTYAYGEESIEIAPNESLLREDDDEDDVGTDGILDQSDLAERIIDAEKKFSMSSINTSYFSSKYFDHPALYRVLFMGSTTAEKKRELFKKLSQGFVHVLQQRPEQPKPAESNSSTSLIGGQPITPFKEIKHNVLLLSDVDEPDLISDSYEDIGVSMIEADFTWNSNAVTYSNHPDNLLLQYAWHQCPNPRELPAASWLEAEVYRTKFTGFMYPQTTPNGIDLCVYFYDGQDDERTKQDLKLLCTLRKLGIYVLPLTTTSRDEKLKSHLADLLTEYQVRCLDLGGNLEVGREEPSFFQKKNVTLDRINRLQDMECTQFNVPAYQILTVDQFCGIENKAIFQLLKRTRERQVIREEVKEELISERQQLQQLHPVDSDDSSSDYSMQDTPTRKRTPVNYHNNNSSRSSSSCSHELFSRATTATSSGSNHTCKASKHVVERSWYFDHIQFLKAVLVGIMAVVIARHYLFPARSSNWTAQFEIKPDLSFILSTRDPSGELVWADIAPQVWLNDEHLIPIEKIRVDGCYKLTIDPLLLYQQKYPSNLLIPLDFTVNTTDNIIFYNTMPSNGNTFLLLHPNSIKSNATHETKVPREMSSINQHVSREDSRIKNSWDSFVFFASNTINQIANIVFVE